MVCATLRQVEWEDLSFPAARLPLAAIRGALVRCLVSDDFRGTFRELPCGPLLDKTHRAPNVTVPNALDDEALCRSIHLLQVDITSIIIAKMAKQYFTEIPDTMDDCEVCIAIYLRESNRYPPSHLHNMETFRMMRVVVWLVFVLFFYTEPVFAFNCGKALPNSENVIHALKDKISSRDIGKVRVFFRRYNHNPPIAIYPELLEKRWEIEVNQKDATKHASSLIAGLQKYKICASDDTSSLNWGIVIYDRNGARIISVYAERRYHGIHDVRGLINESNVIISGHLLDWFESCFLERNTKC
jgi:hypothetical protein